MDGSGESRRGTIAAFATYGMWGLFPLYWKQLAAVDPVQILCHRIFWAAIFSVLLLAASRRLGDLAAIFKSRAGLLSVACSGALITFNWGIYIWAVNHGRITESSLGYYINPLLSIVLGAVFFRERLDRWTKAAFLVAAAGVAGASIMLGTPPWISLALATSFALYGAVKKRIGLEPALGLAAETLIVAPLAIAYLMVMGARGEGALGGPDLKANVLLVLAGVVTAVPLLSFAYATNRISLQRIGFIQYLSPSFQLALGLAVYGERLSAPLALAFATVIAAVLIYALSRRAAGAGGEGAAGAGGPRGAGGATNA